MSVFLKCVYYLKTILLGGPLVGKAIIRIIDEDSFEEWKKAYSAKGVWEELGFDYIPIEPILKKFNKASKFFLKIIKKIMGRQQKKCMSYIRKMEEHKVILTFIRN